MVAAPDLVDQDSPSNQRTAFFWILRYSGCHRACSVWPTAVKTTRPFPYSYAQPAIAVAPYLSKFKPSVFEDVRNVAVTAGASAPEHLVDQLIASLKDLGFHHLEEVELVEEDVRFSLPGELGHAASALTTISTR